MTIYYQEYEFTLPNGTKTRDHVRDNHELEALLRAYKPVEVHAIPVSFSQQLLSTL